MIELIASDMDGTLNSEVPPEHLTYRRAVQAWRSLWQVTVVVVTAGCLSQCCRVRLRVALAAFADLCKKTGHRPRSFASILFELTSSLTAFTW